jgi:hypothetical protein
MAAFEPHVVELETMAGESLSRGRLPADAIATALDGYAGRRLRELVDPTARKAAGAFFTGGRLRRRLLSFIGPSIGRRSAVLDPACGAGDLLVECTRVLPLRRDLVSTVNAWGRQLHAFDIHPEFVRAARARVVLAAVQRGAPLASECAPPLDELLPGIRVTDYLSDEAVISGKSHILLNPPYATVNAPEGCLWSQGIVSAAAVFLEVSMTRADSGTHVAAVLPDVLRTGARYHRWRTRIEALGALQSVVSMGRFDAWTEVDVFIAHIVVGTKGEVREGKWWHVAATGGTPSVADYFDVHVGSVVPHRDPWTGPWRRYIYARLLSGKRRFDSDCAGSRRHTGRPFQPPFVVVRRTTHPDRARRAIGTVITGTRPVLVENHLVVMKPRNDSLALCEQLLDCLDSPKTTAWLDERIRCRHFTVSSLSELPWWGPHADA